MFNQSISFKQRQIDKATDIVEESSNIPDVKGNSRKETILALKSELKSFSEQLEEARERLEDTSRCFQLLESCHDILEDDTKEQEDFRRLALKTGNEKLYKLCNVSQL